MNTTKSKDTEEFIPANVEQFRKYFPLLLIYEEFMENTDIISKVSLRGEIPLLIKYDEFSERINKNNVSNEVFIGKLHSIYWTEYYAFTNYLYSIIKQYLSKPTSGQEIYSIYSSEELNWMLATYNVFKF